MKVIDYEEAMKCLDEVEDSEDKTYAKSLLEWAINKRTFEAVPLSVIEKIKAEINEKIAESMREAPCSEGEARYGFWKALEIIDKVVKECTHEST